MMSDSNCTTWLIDVHPTWSEENIPEVLHLVLLDLQFRHTGPSPIPWILKMILDLKSSSKLIHTTSFKLRPNTQDLDLVHPTVANLRDVCYRTWASLHDIDPDIWPWRWTSITSPISEIDSGNIMWTKPNNQHLDFFKELLNEPLRHLIGFRQP